VSVLACGRYRCDNIMCDRLILGGSRYLCDRCYEELLVFKGTWDHETMSFAEVKPQIEAFMRTEPGTYAVPRDARDTRIEEEFARLTGDY
jgi:hypothetical protein